jgi:hypothetical protein
MTVLNRSSERVCAIKNVSDATLRGVSYWPLDPALLSRLISFSPDQEKRYRPCLSIEATRYPWLRAGFPNGGIGLAELTSLVGGQL